MSFELERDMTDIIRENVYQVINPIIKNTKEKNYIYSYEFPVYYRSIDIVLASYFEEFNNFKECIYYEKRIKSLSHNCLNVLTVISLYNKVSIYKIQNELPMSKEELNECLEKLSKLQMIEKVSKFSYKTREWSVIIPKELIAIELKLYRWKEALEQGIYNKQFAEYSIVVLDDDRINKDTANEIENEYKANNVGLVYLSSKGIIQVKVIPKRNKDIDKYVNKYHKIKILKDFVTNNKWKKVL